MATAQVKKSGKNLGNQSGEIQVGFFAFCAQWFFERVWNHTRFPILKTSQVVLSQNRLMHLLAGLVHQPRILRNVFLTNNEHEVAFAVIYKSQKFSHHTYTSIHHNEPSISSIITLRS